MHKSFPSIASLPYFLHGKDLCETQCRELSTGYNNTQIKTLHSDDRMIYEGFFSNSWICCINRSCIFIAYVHMYLFCVGAYYSSVIWTGKIFEHFKNFGEINYPHEMQSLCFFLGSKITAGIVITFQQNGLNSWFALSTLQGFIQGGIPPNLLVICASKEAWVTVS